MGGSTTRFFMFLSVTATPTSMRSYRYCPSLVTTVSYCLRQSHQCSRRNVLRFYPSYGGLQFLSQSRYFYDMPGASASSSGLVHSVAAQHPWPEWSGVVDYLSSAGCYTNLETGGNVSALSLPAGAAAACFAFARQRPDLLWKLPRKDVEELIENGVPFLFDDGEESIRRMKLFLTSNVLDSADRAEISVDLMKYLLSYAHNALSGSNAYNAQLVESCVRNLLLRIGELGNRSDTGFQLNEPTHSNMNDSYKYEGAMHNAASVTRPSFVNIEMKRGDWICPRCSFLNFARNMQCLECDEDRPKRVLTGGEWECPQCDFYNYGRNAICLRCDCKRPSEVSLGSTNTHGGLLARQNSGLRTNGNVPSKLIANEVKTQSQFNEIFHLENTDFGATMADKDISVIMPLSKEDKFVTGNRKTPLERRVADVQRKRNANTWGSMECYGNQNAGEENIAGGTIKQKIDEVFSRRSVEVHYETVGKINSGHANVSSNEPEDKYMVGNNMTDVKKPLTIVESIIDSKDKSKEVANRPIPSLQENNEVSKDSDRWFQRVTELHNIKDASSEIPDFMPLREGENRFVLGKMKDRSLASPLYKRRMAMEPSSSGNNVPFVPFPPNFFARDHDSAQNSKATDGASNTYVRENFGQAETMKGSTADHLPQYITTSHKDSRKFEENAVRNYDTSADNVIATNSLKGKSLEDPLVKQQDPLDMSEEAKTERWFKRVAQIKDISELSEIPDEDFPSIMPMRKGVNRFVVTKRKTPLERRIASSQIRRNITNVRFDSTQGSDDTVPKT